MNRWARVAGMLLGVAAFAVSPWVGALRSAPAASQASPGVVLAIGTSVEGRPLPQAGDRRRVDAPSDCDCVDIVLDAINELRDAEVESGDAEVRNVAVTYISAAFMATIEGNYRLRVEQRADAVTGDAIAGQILGAMPAAGRCANVLIRAINILEDVEVRSGDAVAKNRNVVLLDPGVDVGRIDLDVTQEANATSGEAVAGQIIGASAGADDGCGSVVVEATNELKDVEVETGDARMRNKNDVRTCAAVGCIAELLKAGKSVAAVRMCTEIGCRFVPKAELLAQLEAAAPPPEPTPEPLVAPPGDEESEDEDGEASGSPSPTPDDEPPGPGVPLGSPTPSPTPASA